MSVKVGDGFIINFMISWEVCCGRRYSNIFGLVKMFESFENGSGGFGEIFGLY